MKSKNIFILLLASFAGCIETAFITDPAVTPPVLRLVVAPANAAMQVGQNVQLQALLVEGNANGVPVSNAQWSSSDSNVVAISATGLAAGRNPGQARITARAHSLVSDAVLVTVVGNANQVARVVVSPHSVQRALGGTQQFAATAFNLNGDVITGRTASWSSSNASVVSIHASGLATANGNGSANITATVDGIESVAAQFTVASNTRTGTFVMRPNSGHDVRGTATLTQQANGSLTLELGSDFASAGGPDVRLYLSQTNSVGANSVDLGRLRSYTGAQSYSVPANVQLTSYDWVIVHCVPFNITFGYARLQ